MAIQPYMHATTDYSVLFNRTILADDDIPPLYGISGGTAFFEAWDANIETLVVGMFAAEITPEIVAEAERLASIADDDWVGALVVPPTLTLTDKGRALCKDIIVYRCVMTLEGLQVDRIDAS